MTGDDGVMHDMHYASFPLFSDFAPIPTLHPKQCTSFLPHTHRVASFSRLFCCFREKEDRTALLAPSPGSQRVSEILLCPTPELEPNKADDGKHGNLESIRRRESSEPVIERRLCGSR